MKRFPVSVVCCAAFAVLAVIFVINPDLLEDSSWFFWLYTCGTCAILGVLLPLWMEKRKNTSPVRQPQLISIEHDKDWLFYAVTIPLWVIVCMIFRLLWPLGVVSGTIAAVLAIALIVSLVLILFSRRKER